MNDPIFWDGIEIHAESVEVQTTTHMMDKPLSIWEPIPAYRERIIICPCPSVRLTVTLTEAEFNRVSPLLRLSPSPHWSMEAEAWAEAGAIAYKLTLAAEHHKARIDATGYHISLWPFEDDGGPAQ